MYKLSVYMYRMNGRCEVALTARTIIKWPKFRICGELLCGKRFLLNLNIFVFKDYMWPAILCGVICNA